MRKYFLESERIGFGVWDSKDLELARKLWGNRQVTEYISGKGYFSEEEISERLIKEIGNQEKYKVQYWPIFKKDTHEFIGCCGLRPYDLNKKIYEIGIHILPQYWGKGIGSEAINTVIEYAFKETNISLSSHTDDIIDYVANYFKYNYKYEINDKISIYLSELYDQVLKILLLLKEKLDNE